MRHTVASARALTFIRVDRLTPRITPSIDVDVSMATIDATNGQALRSDLVRITHNRNLETFLARPVRTSFVHHAPQRSLKVNCGDFLNLISEMSQDGAGSASTWLANAGGKRTARGTSGIAC
jgi:hypothetical protein